MNTLALVAALILGAAADDFILANGDFAPPFSMRDLNNETFSLGDYVGTSPKHSRSAVFLVFFATWCEPCKKEIPIVKRIHQRWQGQGLEVVYIGLSQGAKELGPFAKAEKLPWRVIPDTFGLLSRRYGASQLPHALIVDKSGRVAFQHRGIAPNLQELIEAELSRVTGKSIPTGGVAKPSGTTTAPRFDRTLRMGRLPSTEGASTRWEPLVAYLGEMTQANISIASEPSYSAFEKALLAGRFDVVNAGPWLCEKVRASYEPIASVEREGTKTYQGMIFALRKSRLRKLEDLAGKTLGLVAPESTSGGLYPQKALLDAGLIPGKNVTIRWLGSHSKVAEAVKNGTVDAGGCYEDCRDHAWSNPKLKGIVTVVLGYTDPIPAEMIAVRRDLEPQIKNNLRAALLKLNEQEGVLEQMSKGELPISALSGASDADLDTVGKVATEVRKRSQAR